LVLLDVFSKASFNSVAVQLYLQDKMTGAHGLRAKDP
jgi:hypothetical protein